MLRRLVTPFVLAISLSVTCHVFAWNDATHIAVGQAIGYHSALRLTVPDTVKLQVPTEKYSHYYDVHDGEVITRDTVLAQLDRVGTEDPDGHLYGAILQAVRNYRSAAAAGSADADYHMLFVGHYVGDLSAPLHNYEYNAFNIKFHSSMDGVVGGEVLTNLGRIHVINMTITSEDELIDAIIDLAKDSHALASKLDTEQSKLAVDDAYAQLSKSASLFKAILNYCSVRSSVLH